MEFKKYIFCRGGREHISMPQEGSGTCIYSTIRLQHQSFWLAMFSLMPAHKDCAHTVLFMCKALLRILHAWDEHYIKQPCMCTAAEHFPGHRKYAGNWHFAPRSVPCGYVSFPPPMFSDRENEWTSFRSCQAITPQHPHYPFPRCHKHGLSVLFFIVTKGAVWSHTWNPMVEGPTVRSSYSLCSP